MKYSLLLLIVLLVFLPVSAVSAAENQVNVMYLGYGENPFLKIASGTNQFNDSIIFTNLDAYGSGLQEAADSGLIGEQDVVLCDMLSPSTYDPIADALQSAHDGGTVFVDIRSTNEPPYFDYVYRDSRKNPVRYYYDRMGSSGTGLENAENLLICLAKDYANRSDVTGGWDVDIVTMQDWANIKITYLGHEGCPALEEASLTNFYSENIEFTALEAYNAEGTGPSAEFLAAAGGSKEEFLNFLNNPDILICDNLSDSIYNYNVDVKNAFSDVTSSGIYIVDVHPPDQPFYRKFTFNYVYAYETNETATGMFGDEPLEHDEAIGYYYDRMGTESPEEVQNAECLLIYLSKEYGFRPKLTWDWSTGNWDRIKIMYLGSFGPNDALGAAALSSRYSNYIEFTNLNAYNSSSEGLSIELLEAANSGLIEEQDVVFCDMFWDALYVPLNDSFFQAHLNGTAFVDIRSANTPNYFDYVSNGSLDDPICNYYNNMGVSGEVEQKNAENLLVYLAKEYANRPDITAEWDSIRIMYLGRSPSVMLEKSLETHPYKSYIDFTNLGAYNSTTGDPAEELLTAIDSGLFELQDVLICDNLSYPISADVDEAFALAAEGNETYLAAFGPDSPPSPYSTYFDSSFTGSENNTLCSFYTNMTLDNEDWLENSQNFLICLVKEDYANSSVARYWSYADESTSLGPKIYYMDSENEPHFFESTSEFLDWYGTDTGTHRVYDPTRPTIGIWFHKYDYQYMKTGVVDALIREIESRDCNVIAGYDTFDEPLKYYCDENGIPLVQCVISLKSFRLNVNDAPQGVEDLKALNVPVLKGMVAEETATDNPADATRGVPNEQVVRKSLLPNLDGMFEFVLLGTCPWYSTDQEIAPYEPIPSQINWITNRSIRWAELKFKENSEKNVAIIYYNYPSGKDNIGASYLDTITSMHRLLKLMEAEGYTVTDVPETPDGLLEMIYAQGINAGSWAPGVLEEMVENRQEWGLQLIPVETYHGWFKTLPEDLQADVIAEWGEPWSEDLPQNKSLMYWDDASGKRYIVIPAVQYGNVWIMPQPVRGMSQGDDELYHSSLVPPPHQYIAFYYWLNKNEGWKPDAIVHMGTHGTHEWLPGSEYGMDRENDWSPLLLQDLPNIYPYIVANVGEGLTAEYRGNALIIDHLTPTLERSGSYGEVEKLYRMTQEFYSPGISDTTKKGYQMEIVSEMEAINMDSALDLNTTELYNMSVSDFGTFVKDVLHEYLEDITGENIPYGMHILGEYPSTASKDPQSDELTFLVRGLLGDGFEANVTGAFYSESPYPGGIPGNDTKVNELVWEVVRNNTATRDAQLMVYGFDNDTVNADLLEALLYREELGERNESKVPGLVRQLLGTEFENTLETVFYSNTTEYPEGIPAGDTKLSELVELSLNDSFSEEEAQDLVYGFNNSSVSSYLRQGSKYKFKIMHPTQDEIAAMVRSMMGSRFEENVTGAFYSNKTLYPLGIPYDDFRVDEMVWEVISNSTDSEAAQLKVFEDVNVSVSADLERGLVYRERLINSSQEIDRVVQALDGGFVPPGPGRDPVQNTNSVPTGRNFYGVDPGLYPSEATWKLGKMLAIQLLEDYYSKHGEYPRKVSFSRFGVEFIRDHGTLEAEALYLLGVKPTWDANGYVNGLVLLNESELLPNYDPAKSGRPRIDIVYATAGMRDAFPDKLQMIDEAVRMANMAPNSSYPNYVNESTQAIYEDLYNQFLNETGNETEARELAETLSTMRCFAVRAGTYALPVSSAVEASGTWEDESEIADIYLNKMGFAYGTDLWGYECRSLLEGNLMNVDASVHSDSSNLYDTLDNDDFYQYFGGLNLATRYVSGKTPEMYVSDTRDPENAEMVGMKEYLMKDIYSRYLNPKWIEGMQASGYDGARMMSKVIEHLWGWEVMDPDLIDDSVWEEFYRTYINDPDMEEWFNEENPYAQQAMDARMLETMRKGYWENTEIRNQLVSEYVESVVENGVTCCHHTCGNPLLDSYVEGLMSVVGVDPKLQEKYRQIMDEATKPPEKSSSPSKKSSSPTGEAKVLENSGNQSFETDTGGYGLDSSQPSSNSQSPEADPDYVEGYEMQKEDLSEDDPSSPMSFSGADIVGVLFVLASLGAIYLGFRKRKF